MFSGIFVNFQGWGDVEVEGGDTSLTAGLAAGGVAAVGAIGAAVGLSGDKPDAEVRWDDCAVLLYIGTW